MNLLAPKYRVHTLKVEFESLEMHDKLTGQLVDGHAFGRPHRHALAVGVALARTVALCTCVRVCEYLVLCGFCACLCQHVC